MCAILTHPVATCLFNIEHGKERARSACTCSYSYSASGPHLVMQDDIQQRTVNLQSSIVFNESELTELVHECADPCSRRPNYRCQCLLADLRNYLLRFALLPEIGQQQQNSRQPLLTGVEQLVDEIFLDLDVAGEQMGNEHLGERGFIMEETNHSSLLQFHDRARGNRDGGGHAQRLSGQTTFPEKIAF